jgi:hypothetical protein
MGAPTARANFPRTPSDCRTVPISLRTSRLAVMRSTATIASLGRLEGEGPRWIQRCEP